MTNEVDSFLDDLKGEQQDPFEPVIEEPKPEVKDEEDKPLPFHQDPKVQRYVERQIEKAIEKIKPTETEKFLEDTKGDYGEVIGAFTTIIGNDTPEKQNALKALEKSLQSADQRAAQKATERLESLQQEAQEENERETAEALDELNQGFEDIEETFKVDLNADRTQRGEFVDYITKIAPKDRNGEVVAFPDMVATYEAFKAQRKSTNSRAKDLASRSLSRSSDASNVKPPTDNSWNAVDKILGKLN